MGRLSPNHQWDVHRCSMLLLTLVQARGTSISPRVLHKNLLLHRWAREARVRVEVEDRAHRPRLQGPKGMSTPSYRRLSQQINWSYRVCFYYLAYRRGYYLIMIDRPKTRCINCTPMCASARVAPSNIVYSWYGYRSTGTCVLTTKVLLFR